MSFADVLLGTSVRPARVTTCMRTLSAVAGAAVLVWSLAGLARAETPCGQTLDAPLRPRTVLTIHSRPAGLEIVGTDQAAIHVSCTSGDEGDAQRIHIRFQGNQDDETLTIAGDLRKGNNLRVRIEVPRKTSLRVDMSAGEVKVEEIAGDKDIDLYAGRIAISSTRPWDYRSVDVSVSIGAVKAPVYGAEKGGFFRGITKETAGRRVFAACPRDHRRDRSTGQIAACHHRLACPP